MKCKDLQCQILLAESGELTGRALEELNTHLAGCSTCRQYREDLNQITGQARDVLPTGEPTRETLSRIRAAADQQASSKMLRFPQPFTQVLAYAATIALVVAGWIMMSRPQNPELTQINDFDAIMAYMADEGAADEGESEVMSAETEISELARQLLLMEGLTLDQYSDSEEAIQLDVLDPTALQSRNTPAPRVEKCV